MREFPFGRVTPVASLFTLIIAVTAPAVAQTPAPAPVAPAPVAPSAPPPGQPAVAPQAAPPAAAAPPGYTYAPPPPGYAYAYPAPPGYAPGYAAPSLRQPESAPYHGGPIPSGYHLEERPRRGLIIGGALTLGIPWMLGITIASTDDFSNQSGWLIVPALGPWITIATRDPEKDCSLTYASGSTPTSVCHDDNAVRTVLILDGLTQAAGTFMLIYGLSSPKKVIARDFVSSLHFTPARMGKLGYGGVLSGEF